MLTNGQLVNGRRATRNHRTLRRRPYNSGFSRMYTSSIAWAAFRLATAWPDADASWSEASLLCIEAGLAGASKSPSSTASLSLGSDSSSSCSSGAYAGPSSGEPAASTDSGVAARASAGWASDKSLSLGLPSGTCALTSSADDEACPFTGPGSGDVNMVLFGRELPAARRRCQQEVWCSCGPASEGLRKSPPRRPGISKQRQSTGHGHVSMMVVASRGV